jgi:glucuronate isomerase
MELKRPFGIDEALTPSTARRIFDRCNEQLAGDDFTAMGILRSFRVAVVCTTDDPAGPLDAHRQLAMREGPDTQVYPTRRPDRAMATNDVAAWNRWVDRLGQAAECSIDTWAAFLARWRRGTRNSIALGAAPLTTGLHRLAVLDRARGWVQQFHLGALRNVSTRMRGLLGPDTGFDAIGDFEQAGPLTRFLDTLDETNQLAKTILYNMNPAWNSVFATIAGSFNDGVTPGKMQFGAAWWFLD